MDVLFAAMNSAAPVRAAFHYAASRSAKRAEIQSSISLDDHATERTPVVFTGRGKSLRPINSYTCDRLNAVRFKTSGNRISISCLLHRTAKAITHVYRIIETFCTPRFKALGSG